MMHDATWTYVPRPIVDFFFHFFSQYRKIEHGRSRVMSWGLRDQFGCYVRSVSDKRMSLQICQDTLRPCLVHPENQKVFKILRHIESCVTCMKH